MSSDRLPSKNGFCFIRYKVRVTDVSTAEGVTPVVGSYMYVCTATSFQLVAGGSGGGFEGN